jgi:hypothetical protein
MYELAAEKVSWDMATTWLENKRKRSKSSLLFLLVSYFMGAAAEEREDIIFVHCSTSLLADSTECSAGAE